MSIALLETTAVCSAGSVPEPEDFFASDFYPRDSEFPVYDFSLADDRMEEETAASSIITDSLAIPDSSKEDNAELRIVKESYENLQDAKVSGPGESRDGDHKESEAKDSYLPQADSYSAPPIASYSAPPKAYGPPPKGYGRPKPSYGPPPKA